MKLKHLILAVLLSLPLSGCMEAAFDVAHFTRDNTLRLKDKWYWEGKAENGDAEAQYMMGKYYCCGQRPMRDDIQSLNWYCKAARQNQRDALLEVGKRYEEAHKTEGSIIPRDLVMAYVYYVKAAEHDNEAAPALRERVSKQLTETQRPLAAVLLSRWPNVGCGTLPPPKSVRPKSTPVHAVPKEEGNVNVEPVPQEMIVDDDGFVVVPAPIDPKKAATTPRMVNKPAAIGAEAPRITPNLPVPASKPEVKKSGKPAAKKPAAPKKVAVPTSVEKADPVVTKREAPANQGVKASEEDRKKKEAEELAPAKKEATP